MARDTAGTNSSTSDSVCNTAARIAELRQAVKDCYCGLGPECTHWNEMTPEGREACSYDKRAAIEAMWRNGTVA